MLERLRRQNVHCWLQRGLLRGGGLRGMKQTKEDQLRKVQGPRVSEVTSDSTAHTQGDEGLGEGDGMRGEGSPAEGRKGRPWQ